MRKYKKLLPILLTIILLISCTTNVPFNDNRITQNQTTDIQNKIYIDELNVPKIEEKTNIKKITSLFDLDSIPAYNGSAFAPVNNNIPFFTSLDYTTTSFETYEELDSLGRCGVAFACIGVDIMPTEERENIGSVKPTGWHTVRYENIDGRYLYNRCHLLGYQLTGENANEGNLITGTRYLNVEGMLPFENMVADYVQETRNHVLLRVTPIFDKENLLASGVLMEGLSVEDNGEGICFNVYCYNVQPGIIINYQDGSNYAADGSAPYGSSARVSVPQQNKTISSSVSTTYIANKNTKKFHYSHCSSVGQMKENNKKYLKCTRDEAINSGYDSCGRCNP